MQLYGTLWCTGRGTCLIPSTTRGLGLRRIRAWAVSCKWPIRTQNDCVHDNAELAAARIKRLSFSNRKSSSPANHLKPFVIKPAWSGSTKARAYIRTLLYRSTRHRRRLGDNLKPAKGRWSLHCARVKPATQKPLSSAPRALLMNYNILYYLL